MRADTPKTETITMYLTEWQKETIIHNAKQFELSISEYTSRIVLDVPLPNLHLADAAKALLSTSYNLIRANNLIKLALASDDSPLSEDQCEALEMLRQESSKALNQLQEKLMQI